MPRVLRKKKQKMSKYHKKPRDLDTNMTQGEVAEAMGLPRVTIQKIEMRAFEKIRREMLKRKIDVADLLS